MPYYGIPVSQTNEDVAMAYNKYILTNLLREELRNYFEISKDHIVVNAFFVSGNKDKAEKYIKDKKIDLNSKAPWLR